MANLLMHMVGVGHVLNRPRKALGSIRAKGRQNAELTGKKMISVNFTLFLSNMKLYLLIKMYPVMSITF